MVEWCPILYFSLLNYVYLVLQATNMPSNQRRRPPKPHSGKRPRGKSNHKGDKLQQWNVLDMRNALVQYFSQRAPGYSGKQYGYKKIAEAYHIPKETFCRRVRGPLTSLFGHLSGGKDFPRIFTTEEELDLARHISLFAQAGFPFTTTEIRSLGFEFAEERGIEGFSVVKKVAGRKWFKGFMNRHSGLGLKSPKLLSVYRAKCANRDVLDGWFDIYEKLIEEKGITSPVNIWNVDECGCIDTPKPKQIVCPVKARPNQLCSSEKGETSTAVVFVNAAGFHLKPLVIHKGARVQDAWKHNMVEGTTLGVSENGWIDKRLFYNYGKKLIEYLRGVDELGPEKNNILLMDSHNSHTFNFQFIQLMNTNNIHVLALSAHTTHCLQPLDDVPFANFKGSWYEGVRKYVRSSGAKKLSKAEFFNVFSPAWVKAITVNQIKAGFRNTGVWPVDRKAISDSKIGPSLQQDVDSKIVE